MKYLIFSLTKLLNYDPRRPISSFNYQIKILKVCGLWSLKDSKKKKYYDIYAKFSIVFWVYLHLIFQIGHLFEAKMQNTEV